MSGYRVLDIETVVDHSVWDQPADKWKLVPNPVFNFSSSPSHGENVFTVQSASPLFPAWPMVLQPESPFAPPQAHRIVAMSWIDLSNIDNKYYFFEAAKSYCQWSHSDLDEPERELLITFNNAESKDSALIVTWNGRQFDMPVISMRAFKHKIALPWYYQDRDMRYRFSDAGHCDLMDYLGDYGGSRFMKLGDVARLIGLPGKQGEVSGASVADFYARGDDFADMRKVGQYCLSDALQTAIVFLRSRFHKGMISAPAHDDAISSFVDSGIFRDTFGPKFDHQPLFVCE